MTSIDASTMSRLVSRLVRDRPRHAQPLGENAAARSWSRSVAKGRALVQRLIPIAKKLEQTASAGLPAKELAVVKRALARMYDNLVGRR